MNFLKDYLSGHYDKPGALPPDQDDPPAGLSAPVRVEGTYWGGNVRIKGRVILFPAKNGGKHNG